ncbi:hypothetical protein BGP_4163 [Beggiatoa sp. PS]|nr:hypothetical protein BGP_4163 [Beggiatoa sp. PS]
MKLCFFRVQKAKFCLFRVLRCALSLKIDIIGMVQFKVTLKIYAPKTKRGEKLQNAPLCITPIHYF